MKYRQFANIERPASLFGLGCMRFNGQPTGDLKYDEEKAIRLIRQAIDGGVNYIDTAYIYLDKSSEGLVGKALQGGYRERVTIATKMPLARVSNYESMESLLDIELKKLKTDYIDYYLMHGINRDEWNKFKAIGADHFFDDMKKAGKIRYKCFSFHGPYEEFEYILKDYDWDMVQIQYNFMDTENQAGTKGLKLAAELGIPVVIMEGLLGGKLAKAPKDVQALYDAFPVKRTPVEWAFRWLGDHPEVMTILSGCNEPEQIEENLRIFGDLDAGCMDESELELIEKVKDAYRARTKIGCTGCSYCMPCPNGVDIPKVFSIWNEISLYENDPAGNWRYNEIMAKGATPDKCIACGKCMEACPQHLEIIDQLQTAWKSIQK